MKTYTLIPKNGRGCTWYVNADQIFKRGLVEAFAKDGFTTLVRLEDYNICR
nr:hypothetical protein [uncultured Oscillibacter sp.]